MITKNQFEKEIAARERFEFGRNWKKYLNKISDERIFEAEKSFKNMLKIDNLIGKKFLDIGSGSGLFSLIARKNGANVFSFDYDESSVWCTEKLKSEYYPADKNWQICQGSILDNEFLESLEKFDIVYSWGVLHHTGQMWFAIDNALMLVKNKGLIYIAIYNDQGIISHIWWVIKAVYNKLPKIMQKPFAYIAGFTMHFIMLIKYTMQLKPMKKISELFNYKKLRGMSLSNDLIDWFGGFPFEFSKYDHLINYIENKGFEFINGIEVKNAGCHELIFRKK